MIDKEFDCVNAILQIVQSKCDEILKQNQENIQKKRSNLEKTWQNWDVGAMLSWFGCIFALRKLKYINVDCEDCDDGKVDYDVNVNANANSTSLNWEYIENRLNKKEWNGRYLSICNEKELKKIGFNNENDRLYLLKKIDKLVNDRSTGTDSTNEIANNNNDRNQSECIICADNKIDTICIPCGHACMCKQCSNDYVKQHNVCPICTTKYDDVFDCFIS